MTSTPFEVVSRHMAAFGGGDLPAITRDYAENAVLALPDRVYQGRQAIHEFFAPQRAGPYPPKIDAIVHPAQGQVVEAEWIIGAGSPDELRGRDVFVITDGEISFQALYFAAANSAVQADSNHD